MKQEKNRLAMEKKKANEERRKRENHHKYMMGGVIHKYFSECYCFEESEIDEIIRVAFRTEEVQKQQYLALKPELLTKSCLVLSKAR